MGYDPNGNYYPDPFVLSGSEFDLALVTADAYASAFSMYGAKDLWATLNIHAFYVTALAGANNDVALLARTPGSDGESITITLVDPSGNDQALAVTVTGTDISVSLATGPAGAITTTAAELKAALEADTDANALVKVVYPASNDGTGVVTALAQQSLAGATGTSPTLDVTLYSAIDDSNYFSVAAFAQQNATNQVVGKLFTGAIGTKSKWYFDVGGTTPVFAVSITSLYRP